MSKKVGSWQEVSERSGRLAPYQSESDWLLNVGTYITFFDFSYTPHNENTSVFFLDRHLKDKVYVATAPSLET